MAYRYDQDLRRDGDGTALALAEGLGWFSIGLGLAELAAPHSLARFLGMEGHAGLIRAYGVREVVTGVGILAQDDPTPWVWPVRIVRPLFMTMPNGTLSRSPP